MVSTPLDAKLAALADMPLVQLRGPHVARNQYFHRWIDWNSGFFWGSLSRLHSQYSLGSPDCFMPKQLIW
jgi:hypothetical protein